MKSKYHLVCWSLLLFSLMPALVRAELPLIRFDRLFPLGGKAGSTVMVEVSGRDMEDLQTLHFDHPGFKVELVKDRNFKVHIGEDVPTGTYEVRVVGKFGISGARIFAVSRGLEEVLETEPNNSIKEAQKVAVNSVINAKCDNNGDDYFRFTAKKGQRITIDCHAFRINTTLRGILSLATSDGKELLHSKPYYNRTDPFLDFTVPADGDYVLRMHDMIYRGNLVYRMVISDHPQFENAFPSAVVGGQKTTLTLLGRNLPGAKTSSAGELEQAEYTFVVPGDSQQQFDFRFLKHLPSPNLNARGLQIRPDAFKFALNPVTLCYADAPVTLDKESNDSAEQAQTITLPTVISGRFDKSGDADWYMFDGKGGDVWSFDLLCERLDFPGDPFVIVMDEKGNELQTFDDHGINRNSLAQFNRDPLGTYRLPRDGKYRVFVQERYRNGGGRFQYVLRIVKEEADFYPVVYHETPSDPSCPLVRQGGSAFYEICLNRRDFRGPVTIEAENLPPGVKCPPIHVSPQSQFAVAVFTADEKAPSWSGAIKLKAWAVVDGKRVERAVRTSQRRWAIGNINTSVALREVCLAVRDTAPYALTLPTQPLKVNAGGDVSFEVTAKRHWADFKNSIQIDGLELPPGFSLAKVTMAADKTTARAELKVAGNVPPGLYSVVVRGDAQVPYNRDPKATSRPNVRVADPSTPMIVEVLPAPKK